MERSEKRILAVDDDDAIRSLLLIVLRRKGFIVDTATNGAEALERCARCRYSLIILDLMMPRMSGYAVLREIEKWPRESRPAIVVLTAGNEPRNLSPDLVIGTIRKPFDVEMFSDMIAGSLSTSAERDQLETCPPAESDAASRRGSPDKVN
jgi:CheY-like chemotaxis protein